MKYRLFLQGFLEQLCAFILKKVCQFFQNMLKQNTYFKIVDVNEYLKCPYKGSKVAGNFSLFVIETLLKKNLRCLIYDKKLLTYSTFLFFCMQLVYKQLALGT